MKDNNHQAFISMGTGKHVKAQATLLPDPGSLSFQLHGPLAAPLRQRPAVSYASSDPPHLCAFAVLFSSTRQACDACLPG